jgi:AcrR family transcriptional regulator
MIHSYSGLMVRSSAEERLERVVSAATSVFAAKGYRRTQMADVAAEVGVSAGNLYNYVESKDALFHACLVAASPAKTNGPPLKLPLRQPPPAATRKVIGAGLTAILEGSALSRALERGPTEDIVAELAEVIGDYYDRTASSRRFQALVERSAADLPELFDAFFVKMRRPALDQLASYIEQRIASGHLRPVPSVEITARLINEAQSWFARNRHGDPDTKDVDDALVRDTVIDVLSAALLTDSP